MYIHTCSFLHIQLKSVKMLGHFTQRQTYVSACIPATSVRFLQEILIWHATLTPLTHYGIHCDRKPHFTYGPLTSFVLIPSSSRPISCMVQHGSTMFCADCPGLVFVNRPLDGSLILCTLYCTLPGCLSTFGPTECNWHLNLKLHRKCSASSNVCLSISLIQFLLASYPIHDFKYFLYLGLKIRVKFLFSLQDIQKLLKQERKGGDLSLQMLQCIKLP